MSSRLSFPIHHLSVRVPWHDAGWNGTVCVDPGNNSACLKLKLIAESKDDAREALLAGRHFASLQPDEMPPCLRERAAFMSPHGVDLSRNHPYRRNNRSGHYSHFKATLLHFGPYSAPAMPFRWMLREQFKTGNNKTGLYDLHPLDEVNEALEWLKRHGIVPREDGRGSRGTLLVTRDSDDGGIDSEAVSKLIDDVFQL